MARAALGHAMAVVEFLAAFGGVCEARPLGLAELQHAAAWPLDSSTLSALYEALLRCVLLELARARPKPLVACRDHMLHCGFTDC